MFKFIFSTNHKHIGLMFLFGSLSTFALAGFAAMLIRIEQSSIGATITDNPTDFNVWLHFHGTAMILGYVIPGLTGFFASYFIPLMIGAEDVAFPRMNSFSLWLYLFAVLMVILGVFIPHPLDIMWTGYPPYSISKETNTSLYAFTILFLGVSATLSAVNFLITIHNKRAKGMTYNKLNVFTWTMIAAFADQLIFVPVLAASSLILLSDKYMGTHFFDMASGGDPLLYQNLFWFYSHPAVYVIFLPAVGIVFEILSTMAQNRVFLYRIAVYIGIGGTILLAGEVWIHHLYVSGMPDWLRAAMMITTLLISVPVGLLVISMWGTLYKGSIRYNTATLYAVAAMLMILLGGLTGIPVGIVSIDLHLSDTTYVHAHFHFAMALFATFAIFGGIYYWFPKLTGKMVNEKIGKTGFALNFIGTNLTFLPLMYIGVDGMPRRYYDYPMFPEMEPMHKLATIGAIVTFIGALVTLYSWVHGIKKGKAAKDNPWQSKSLEWTHTSASPITGKNFLSPVVLDESWSPYGYQAGSGSMLQGP